MSNHRNGPPKEVGRPSGSSETAQTDLHNRVHSHDSRSGRSAGPRTFARPATPKPLPPRICANAVLLQLRVRRAASQRMVPLDCGCSTGPHADPLACVCTSRPLTDNQLDGWRDATRHILAQGQMPVVPIEVRRALWCRPADRVLAELLHKGCGGGGS